MNAAFGDRYQQVSCANVSELRNSSRGFTAIELAITMAIFAIVIAMGVPSFQSTLHDHKQSAQMKSLRQSLVFARSEAIKRSQHVAVCARATDATCGADWSNGWLVHTDPDSGTPDVLDTNDAILKITSVSSSQLDLSARATVRPLPMQTQTNIRFSPRGRVNWSLGTLLLCDQRGDKHAIGLIVNGAGSLRSAYADASSNGVVVDAMGTPADCT